MPGARTASRAAAWGSQASAGGVGPKARTRGAGRGQGAQTRDWRGPQPTSLSGTHCGSSRPNGLPKARCSGTMRRPLGERTSFLASRRAATSEDMTPPQRSPAALTQTLAPPKAPPRQKPRPTREADSARAQSPSAVRSASQSTPGLRPITVLANPRKGTASATRGQSPIGSGGRPGHAPPLSGRSGLWIGQFVCDVGAASSLIGVSGMRRLPLIGRGGCEGRDGANSERTPGGSCGAVGPGWRRGHRGGRWGWRHGLPWPRRNLDEGGWAPPAGAR